MDRVELGEGEEMADTGRRVPHAVVLLGLVVGLVLPASGQAPAARRLALVIGNAGYAEAAARLSYPVNNARAMTAMLEELGFTVTVETDADSLSASGRVEVTGAQSVYRSGELMQIRIEMPVDGYLNVLSVVEDADYATVLFPNASSRQDNRFSRGSHVRVPDPDDPDDSFDLPVEPEDPGRAEERNVLVVVVSETPLDLQARDVDTVLQVLPAAHATAVPYVVMRR